MVEGQRHFNREIAGIKPSSNHEAKLLENILGIKFSIIPIKVISTIRNRLAFFMNPDIRDYLHMSPINILKHQMSPGKTLPPIYNAIFIKGRPNEELSVTSLHENMHCYTEQVNPEIGSNWDQFMDNIGQYYSEKSQDKPELNIDRAEVLHCFEEGIAEWGTYEVLACLTGFKEDTARRKEIHRKGIRRLPAAIEVQTIESQYIETQLQRLQRRIDELEKRLPRGIEEFLEEYRKMVDDQETQSLYYILGHYLVYEVMNILTESGMSISGALQTLIKNPPNTIIQLRNVKVYAQHLLQR